MGLQGNVYWTTRDEVEFIQGLRKGKREVYENYKKAFFTRKKWNNIDREEVARALDIDLDKVEPNRVRTRPQRSYKRTVP